MVPEPSLSNKTKALSISYFCSSVSIFFFLSVFLMIFFLFTFPSTSTHLYSTSSSFSASFFFFLFDFWSDFLLYLFKLLLSVLFYRFTWALPSISNLGPSSSPYARSSLFNSLIAAPLSSLSSSEFFYLYMLPSSLIFVPTFESFLFFISDAGFRLWVSWPLWTLLCIETR